MRFTHRVMKGPTFGPDIRHTWQVTFDRPRVAVMLWTRTLSYWCVGLSWYGVGNVRDLAVHLGAVSLTLRLRVPERWRAAEALQHGDVVALTDAGARKARG